MKLEQQCVSLELAKRLKELGVKQEGVFVWCGYSEPEWEGDVEFFVDVAPPLPPHRHEGTLECSAFTVAELGEMLPTNVYRGQYTYELHIEPKHSVPGWNVYYERCEDGGRLTLTEAHTEANARAKMLIYLLENKLLTMNK